MSVTEVAVSDPGFGRRGAGTGFSYVDCEGARITDSEVIERIRALAIPPAWRDVWICTDPQGHIQATGLDDAGRRQYLYHPDWRAERDRRKHDRMLELARALPRLRRRVGRDLATDGLGRDRVLACRGAPARAGPVPGGRRGLHRGQRQLRARHPAQGARAGPRRRAALRLPGQERPAARRGHRRSTGGRRGAGPEAAAAGRARAAGLQGRAGPLERHPLGGHQRLPPGRAGRGLLGQGLPHLDRDRAGRGRARRRGRRGVVRAPAARRRGRGGARRGAPAGQHPDHRP